MVEPKGFQDALLAYHARPCDAEAEAVRASVLQWQPVETAPKDGREVILAVEYRAGIPRGVLVGHYMEGGHCIEDHPPIDRGWYFFNGAFFDKASKPTHWMPLPHHPEWKPDGWQPRKQGPAGVEEGS